MAGKAATRTVHSKRAKPLPPARARLTRHLEPVAIPEKLYFRIGEVSELCRLPASVLRFWESEFPQLKPVKSNTGQRMYRRQDVETVLRIRDLLYGRGFTIAGARHFLGSEKKAGRSQASLPFPSVRASRLSLIRNEVQQLAELLNRR
ncbi:MAG TPA: MerR family transcriptional regulator [Terriglobales bacterium]|nr:MerR family transcriptional regulator [Terriglobales bacterium]